MKKSLIILSIVTILAVFVGIFAYINQEKLIERFIQRQSTLTDYNYALLDNQESIKLVTIGTSSPLPSDRAQSCNAVFVNGKFLLFDLGLGSAKKLEALKLPLDSLDGIFISHWHSDHFIDLPAIVSRSWFLGRPTKLDIYGPEPIDDVVRGINQMLHTHIQSSQDQYDATILNMEGAIPISNTIRLPDSKVSIVYDRYGIRVTAFEVKHQNGFTALGYKISYKDKHLVISGDTQPNDLLVEMAQNADLLLQESLQEDFLNRAAELQRAEGHQRSADMIMRYMNNHSTTVEAAQIAHKAGVKKLILTHLAPPPENPISRRFYVSGLDQIFTGSIVLAEDGDVFTID